MSLEVGSRLGHYEVTALIGEGGMGQVYQATDTKLNRQVALKILPEAFAGDPDRLARFQREAQVLASLNHPNIAAIHGLEDSEGTKALVLELVEGPTLADRIAQGPIPVDEALPIAKQIAEALEAAHEAGVIHRDLKPANIKVKDDGTVKVLDFGLAKAFEPEAPDVSASMSPTISLTAAATQMGMVIGTAAYMAPEQASGKVVDKRADVWAFGVVLYEMLTGTRPFAGDDVSKTLARVIDRDPDWSALPANMPPVLGTFLRGCLEKDPRNRVRDIGDVRLAVKGAFESPVLQSNDALAMQQRVGWKRATRFVATAATFALMAGVAVWALRPLPPPTARPLMRFEITPPPTAPLLIPGMSRPVDVSPDGMHFVYWSGTLANTQLMVRPVDSLSATPLQVDIVGDFEGPFISADSAWVGYYSDGALRRISILGGPPVAIAEAPWPRGASWGADDRIIFGAVNGGLFRVSAGGGEPEVLTTPDPEQGEGSHAWPDILPGGQSVLFTILPANGPSEAAQIAVLNLETGEQQVLIPGGSNPRYVPTGHIVYGVGGTLRAVGFNLDRLEVTTNPIPVVDDVGTNASGAAYFGVTQNGSLAYVRGAGVSPVASLVWVDREGREEPVAAAPQFYTSVQLSPDGQRVVTQVGVGDASDLFVYDLARDTPLPFTFSPAADDYPMWTPNGRRIVWSSERDGVRDIVWKAADGTGQVEHLTTSENYQAPFSWSADGQTLVILELRPETGPDIGALSMDGEGTIDWLLEGDGIEAYPDVSPDGRWMAYTTNETGQNEVFVTPFQDAGTERWIVSRAGGFAPQWGPDGRELFFQAYDGTIMAVTYETEPIFRPGIPVPVVDGPYLIGTPALPRAFDISSDGQRFLMINQGATTDAAVEEPEIHVVLNWTDELTRLVPTN